MGGLAGRPSERLSKSVIHHVIDGHFPFGRTVFGSSDELVINYKSGSHTDVYVCANG
jgi:hypothetical protein